MRRAAMASVIILAIAGLAGCGTTVSHPGTTGPPAQPASSPAAPVPSSPPSSTAPAETVVSSRVSYPWNWPNDASRPGRVTHAYPVPPVPELITIRAASHPAQPGQRPYDRMSFTFTTAFPAYDFQFADALTSDPSGRPVHLNGDGLLKVTFHQAQAHTASGRSSVLVQPPAALGLTRMASWALVGDFEGTLTYGIGITWPIRQSNPQMQVRAIEVEKVTAQGQHLYIVAIDVDASRTCHTCLPSVTYG